MVPINPYIRLLRGNTAGRVVHVSNVLKTLLETDEDAVADIRKSNLEIKKRSP